MAVDRDFDFLGEMFMQNNRVAAERMRALLRGVVMGLVDDMDAVVVDAIHLRDSVLLKVSVANTDVAYVIGKQGRTARSLRHIVAVAAGKNELRCTLEIVTPAVRRSDG